MMVCDSGTRSNKVISDSFYWGTCHWKMQFLAPEMQQVLAGILAAILWTYFQGGRMCFKKWKAMKSSFCVLTVRAGGLSLRHFRVRMTSFSTLIPDFLMLVIFLTLGCLENWQPMVCNILVASCIVLYCTVEILSTGIPSALPRDKIDARHLIVI